MKSCPDKATQMQVKSVCNTGNNIFGKFGRNFSGFTVFHCGNRFNFVSLQKHKSKNDFLSKLSKIVFPRFPAEFPIFVNLPKISRDIIFHDFFEKCSP